MHKAKGRKILFTIIISSILTFIGIYFFLKFGGSCLVDKVEKEKIISEIKSAPELAKRFYEIYEVVYPKSLERNTIQYYFAKNISKKTCAECPCMLALYPYQVSFDLLRFSYYMENYVSQKECFNYYVTKADFLNNNVGIEAASHFYFQKNLSELDDMEIIELILMLENPSYYNKIRYQDRLDKRVKQLLKLFEE